MDLLQLSGSILLFIVAHWGYRNVKGKKMLVIGDNKFFNENKNKISPTDYVNLWGVVIFSLIGGLILLKMSFE